MLLNIVAGAIIASFGAHMVNNYIRLCFSGKLEKLEGRIVDIIREPSPSGEGGYSYRLVIEYYNGYNYVTYESNFGTGILLRRVGDRVTIYRNKDNGIVAEAIGVYFRLIIGIILMVFGLATIIWTITNRLLFS